MNRIQAIEAIKASVAKGSSTPILGDLDRNTYLTDELSKLLASCIEPLPVTVVGETYKYGVYEEISKYHIFAVAQRDNYWWLLFIPEIDKFSLAFGASIDLLTILGFASDDALAEWLG